MQRKTERRHHHKLQGLPDKNLTPRISTSRSWHSGVTNQFCVVIRVEERRTSTLSQVMKTVCVLMREHLRVQVVDNMACFTQIIASFVEATKYFIPQIKMEFLLRYSNEDYMRSCERVSPPLYRPVAYVH